MFTAEPTGPALLETLLKAWMLLGRMVRMVLGMPSCLLGFRMRSL